MAKYEVGDILVEKGVYFGRTVFYIILGIHYNGPQSTYDCKVLQVTPGSFIVGKIYNFAMVSVDKDTYIGNSFNIKIGSILYGN